MLEIFPLRKCEGYLFKSQKALFKVSQTQPESVTQFIRTVCDKMFITLYSYVVYINGFVNWILDS